jgi:hypothetical protein
MDNMRHVARNSRGSDAMNVRIKDYDRKVDVLTRELNATRNQTNRSDLMAGATGRKFGDIEVRRLFIALHNIAILMTLKRIYALVTLRLN